MTSDRFVSASGLHEGPAGRRRALHPLRHLALVAQPLVLVPLLASDDTCRKRSAPPLTMARRPGADPAQREKLLAMLSQTLSRLQRLSQEAVALERRHDRYADEHGQRPEALRVWNIRR